jgi:hypothetical protein
MLHNIKDSVGMTQKTHILKMFEKFGMQDGQPAKVLLLFILRKIAFQREKLCLRRMLKKKAGYLMYAMIGTRPDIAFILSKLSKSVSKPGNKDVLAAQKVLKCLQFSKW